MFRSGMTGLVRGEARRLGGGEQRTPTPPEVPPPSFRSSGSGRQQAQQAQLGTWATELRSKALCAEYQKGNCSGKSCPNGDAHVCAVVTRESGHVCGQKHPACKHEWGRPRKKRTH